MDEQELVKLYQEGRRDFSGADLLGADLSEAYLDGADLCGARLIAADLSGAHLSGANLSEARLNGADLHGADLSEACLRGANLWEANLWGANLVGTDLEGTILTKANLGGTDLSGANLSRAYLTGADLEGALLVEANLDGVDLRGANLREANLGGVDLSGIDLSEAHLTEADLGGAKVTQEQPNLAASPVGGGGTRSTPSGLPAEIGIILSTRPWQARDAPFGFDTQKLEEVASYLASEDSRGLNLAALPLWHYLRKVYDDRGIKDRICQAILTHHPDHFGLIATLVPDLSHEMLSTVVDHFLNNPDLWDTMGRPVWVIECIASWAPQVLHPHLSVLREIDEYLFEDALGGAPDKWVEQLVRDCLDALSPLDRLRHLGRVRALSIREALWRLVGPQGQDRPDSPSPFDSLRRLGRIRTPSAREALRHLISLVGPKNQKWIARYNGLLLDERGARRLVFPKARRGIVAQAGHSPHRVGISLDSFYCQRCGTPALLLLDLDVAALDLGRGIRGASHIPVITCECCDPVQARVLNDRIELLGDRWQVTAKEPVTTDEQSLHLAPHRNQWGMNYSVPHAMHQVGGFPAWVQNPEYPTCAGCGKPMTFVVQVDTSDDMGHCFWGEGLCYGFWCDDCSIAATLYQQT
jgi:uncharacterized protein YjbI with pentapeptide repeats